MPEWEPFAAHPAVVFFGGPVARGTAICLARAPSGEDADGWTPLFGPLGALDLGKAPHEVDKPIDEIRVFSISEVRPTRYVALTGAVRRTIACAHPASAASASGSCSCSLASLPGPSCTRAAPPLSRPKSSNAPASTAAW